MKTLVYFVSLFLLAAVVGCASNPPAEPTLKGLSKDDPVYKYVQGVRQDLSRGKVEIITEVMQLTPAESKVFWPIYQDYETELFTLGDQRLELIRQFLAARQANTLDDKKAGELATGYFQFETARLDLVKKYYAIIAKELSALHAAQFTQIEHRVGTVIDLIMASELPLVRGVEGNPDL